MGTLTDFESPRKGLLGLQVYAECAHILAYTQDEQGTWALVVCAIVKGTKYLWSLMCLSTNDRAMIDLVDNYEFIHV